MFEKPILNLVKFELEDILTASPEPGEDTGTPVCTTDCPTYNCPNDTSWMPGN